MFKRSRWVSFLLLFAPFLGSTTTVRAQVELALTRTANVVPPPNSGVTNLVAPQLSLTARVSPGQWVDLITPSDFYGNDIGVGFSNPLISGGSVELEAAAKYGLWRAPGDPQVNMPLGIGYPNGSDTASGGISAWQNSMLSNGYSTFDLQTLSNSGTIVSWGVGDPLYLRIIPRTSGTIVLTGAYGYLYPGVQNHGFYLETVSRTYFPFQLIINSSPPLPPTGTIGSPPYAHAGQVVPVTWKIDPGI